MASPKAQAPHGGARGVGLFKPHHNNGQDNDPLVREFWSRNPHGVDITAIFGPDESGELVEKVKHMDKSGDGFLSADEFRTALEEMAETKALNRKSIKVLLLAFVALLMLLAAFGGLVYVVVELLKEVNVGDDNVMRSSHSNKPARFANAQFNVSDDGYDTRIVARTQVMGGAARRDGEQASTQSSGTVATDMNRQSNLRTEAKDLFSMREEDLADITSISSNVKVDGRTELRRIGVTGYTSSQIASAKCGLTIRQLLFQTTDPLFPLLNVMYVEVEEREGQKKYDTVVTAQLSEEGADKLKLRDGVPDYADICNGTGLANGRRLLNTDYIEEMRGTSRELVSQGHVRGLLFWDAFVGAVVAVGQAVVNVAVAVVETVVEVVSDVVETAVSAFEDVFGVDVLGEAVKLLTGGKSIAQIAGDIKNIVLSILGDVLNGLKDFINWLPFDIFSFPRELLKFMLDLGNQFMPGMATFLQDMFGFMAEWIYLDPSTGRLCIGKGLSDAANLAYTSDDGLFTANFKMPQAENCFGIHWTEIELDFDRIGACFASIFDDNPIVRFVEEVVDEMVKWIPEALLKMLDDIENMILNFIGTVFGSGARDMVAGLLNQLQFTAQQITSAGRRRAILEAIEQLPDEGTPQHVRKLLLHHTATPHERRVFEEILHNVTHRRILASMKKMYGANATLHPNAETHSGSTDMSERRNLLFFTAQDLRNLAWFKSIPFSVSMGAEFSLTRMFDLLSDFKGDVMEHFGVPMLQYEGEFPIFTAISVKVGIRLMLRAPYEFVVVAMNSGIEFRLKLNMNTRIDIATGEIMASLDTSRDGVTGVRLLGSSITGHAFAGFQIEFGLDVGLCLATFCFDLTTNYTQDVFGMGFDFLMDPGPSDDFGGRRRNANASSSPPVNASSSRALLQNSQQELDAIKNRLKFQLQPTNRFYKYRDINFEKAAQCVLDAGQQEYFIGGGYMVARWPMIEVKLKTPAEQFLGDTAIPMVDWVLLDWNHRKYNPNALYSDFVPDGLVDGLSNFINDHFQAAAQQFFGFIGLGDVGEDIANFVRTSIPISDALQFTAAMAAANIPKLEGVLPPNIFQFGVPLFCQADFLPVEALWWTFPVYMPPLLTMALDSLTLGRRKLLGEEAVVQPSRRRLVPPNVTCFSYGHPCSSSTECCGASGDGSSTVVCGYSKQSPWALCLHKDDVMDGLEL